MSDLKERLKNQRKKWHKFNGLDFCLLRPSELQITQYATAVKDAADDNRQQVAETIDLLKQCVIDWKLTEGDILGTDSEIKAHFDTELLELFLSDNTVMMRDIVNKLGEMFEEHIAKVDSLKKS